MDNPPVWNFLGPVGVHSITTPIHMYLQLMGLCIPIFLDDFLMCEINRELLQNQLTFTIRLLYHLGWLVNVRR